MQIDVSTGILRSETQIGIKAAHQLLSVDLLDPAPSVETETLASYHRLLVPLISSNSSVRYSRDGTSRTFELTPGDFIAIPAGSSASVGWTDLIRAVEIRIAPESLQNFAASELGLIAGPGPLARCAKIHDPSLFGLARRMGETVGDSDVGAKVLLDALSKAFLVTLIRTYADRKATGLDQPDGLSPNQYRRILEYARARLSRRITSECLARAAGMSLSVFTRALRASRRATPQEFLMALRIERAEELLADPHVKMGAIAFECGFSDQAHFSRSFRKARGVPPSAWRRARLDTGTAAA